MDLTVQRIAKRKMMAWDIIYAITLPAQRFVEKIGTESIAQNIVESRKIRLDIIFARSQTG
jgi:hypothetical protein